MEEDIPVIEVSSKVIKPVIEKEIILKDDMDDIDVMDDMKKVEKVCFRETVPWQDG